MPLAHPPAARAPALVAAPLTAARVPTMSIGGVGRPPGPACCRPAPASASPASPPAARARPRRRRPAARRNEPPRSRARPLATAYAATASRARRRRRVDAAAAPALDAVRNAFALGGPGFYGGPAAAADPANGPFGAGPANPAGGPFGAGTRGALRAWARPLPVGAAAWAARRGGLPGGPGGLAPFAAPPTIPSMPPSFSSGAQPHLPQVLVSHSDAEVRAGVRLPSPMAPRATLARTAALRRRRVYRRRAGPSPAAAKGGGPPGGPEDVLGGAGRGAIPPRCRRSCRSRWSARGPSEAAARWRSSQRFFLHT